MENKEITLPLPLIQKILNALGDMPTRANVWPLAAEIEAKLMAQLDNANNTDSSTPPSDNV